MTRRRHNDSFYESVVRLRQARPADTHRLRENLRIAAEFAWQFAVALALFAAANDAADSWAGPMSGRFQPLNGADSMDYDALQADGAQGDPDEYRPRPFRVLVCDLWDEDDRHWVRVPAAIGPHDAFSQVRESHPDVAVLHAEEAA